MTDAVIFYASAALIVCVWVTVALRKPLAGLLCGVLWPVFIVGILLGKRSPTNGHT